MPLPRLLPRLPLGALPLPRRRSLGRHARERGQVPPLPRWQLLPQPREVLRAGAGQRLVPLLRRPRLSHVRRQPAPLRSAWPGGQRACAWKRLPSSPALLLSQGRLARRRRRLPRLHVRFQPSPAPIPRIPPIRRARARRPPLDLASARCRPRPWPVLFPRVERSSRPPPPSRLPCLALAGKPAKAVSRADRARWR